MFRYLVAAAGLAAAVVALANSAPAQTYPTRPIRLVVPFAAGSATDTLARVLGQKLAAAEGWNVVIENMAGASGMLAAQNVARAAPDGHTIFVTSNTTHAANQNLFKKLTYDPVGDFEPVGKLGTITLALAVHPSVPASNTKELIAYGKANPGKLSFGSGSSSSRIAGEMLKTLAGFDMLHVPYKSNPMAVTDLLGGQISLVFADISTTLPQIRAGKVKGFGVSSAQRSPLAPDLPTMVEEGVPGYELTAWFAAFVPAKTPKPIVDKLNAELRRAIAVPEIKDKLENMGGDPRATTPAEMRALVASQLATWTRLAKEASISIE